MRYLMNATKLAEENTTHAGTGGVTAGNKGLGFRPAFMDVATLTIYPSRFADGRPAPFHILDGLPDEVVHARLLPQGRVLSTKPTIVSGFERGGFFYTRRSAARACEQWGLHSTHAGKL
jgi:hypothetical protein